MSCSRVGSNIDTLMGDTMFISLYKWKKRLSLIKHTFKNNYWRLFLFLFLFIKMMFVFFLAGIKLAYLYQSQYYAIFKFVNTYSMIKLLHHSYCNSMTYRNEIFYCNKLLLQRIFSLPTNAIKFVAIDYCNKFFLVFY